MENKKEEFALGSRVIERFLGDENFKVENWNEDWKEILNVKWLEILEKNEKDLHWWKSDLHNPHPYLPIMDVFAWWDTKLVKSTEYMFRRFWSPTGIFWPAKIANEYVYTAIIPPNQSEVAIRTKYFLKILPIYGLRFLEWWDNRLVPELERNLSYIFNYNFESASLDDLMILLEDMIDIYERHYKIHWILNFAQFISFLDFKESVRAILGDSKFNSPEIQDLLSRILVSTNDKNWESLKVIYDIKETIKNDPALRNLFESDLSDPEILSLLTQKEEYKDVYTKILKYLKDFGKKSLYVYEYDIPTLEEDPVPLISEIRIYLSMGWDYYSNLQWVKKDQEKAINELIKLIPPDKKQVINQKMEHAIKMAPLTPNHHFYIDQQTNAAAKLVLKKLGEKFVNESLLEDPLDILFLKYDEIRTLYADPEALDFKKIIKNRKEKREKAKLIITPPYIGTITEWSIKEEPYKQGLWGWRDRKSVV